MLKTHFSFNFPASVPFCVFSFPLITNANRKKMQITSEKKNKVEKRSKQNKQMTFKRLTVITNYLNIMGLTSKCIFMLFYLFIVGIRSAIFAWATDMYWFGRYGKMQRRNTRTKKKRQIKKMTLERFQRC